MYSYEDQLDAEMMYESTLEMAKSLGIDPNERSRFKNLTDRIYAHKDMQDSFDLIMRAKEKLCSRQFTIP